MKDTVHMDKNALLYYESACDLRLRTVLHQAIYGFTIQLGKRHLFFRGTDTPFNRASSVEVAQNKYCMNHVLNIHGLPVPKALAISRTQFQNEDLNTLIAPLNFPLVVKPMRRPYHGTDVLCNITHIEQLKKALSSRFEKHFFLLLEAFHGGLNAYRILVYYDQVIGVIQHIPAQVVGDGLHSIQALIDIQNNLRDKLKDKATLGPLKIDEEAIICLTEQQLTENSIPKKNEGVRLAYTCNLSRGGTVSSLGNTLCKENAKLCCRAAHVLGLNFVELDVACQDMMTPIDQSRGVIIDANPNPDISIHENPLSGPSMQISKTMLRRLIYRFPLDYLKSRWK